MAQESIAMDDNIDRVTESFTGKRVLITGGTGFLGKVLLEKLLRSCPKIEQLILIVRAKKGKEPKERIEEMFKNPLFETLLSQRKMEDIMSKITAVNGDMKEKELGLSEESKDICRTANIVIHSAATVRFDEGLRSAVMLNVRGTKYMLELAKTIPNLELMIHVSTAYCHPNEKVLEEKFYPAVDNPHQIIDLMETATDAHLEVITPTLLRNYPNTYTYSKGLAEALIEENSDCLPLILVRPSVVIPIYKEPLKGWTDNINGPTGLLIGAGKGVIRTMYGNENGYADFVPVDCVVHGIMLLTYDFLVNKAHHKVVNFTSSDELSVTWKEITDIGKEIVVNKVPFEIVLWYPGGCMTRYWWLHMIRSILFHWIPAILVDILLFCLGYKPVLVRVQNRIKKSVNMLEYYTNNQFVFKSELRKSARAKMNALERKTYVVDTEGFSITDYYENAIWAARRYLVKEKDESIPRAKIQMKILWFLDLTVKTLFYCYVIHFIYSKITQYVL